MLTPTLAFAIARFAIGLGIVADVLFRDGPAGIAFPIWIALVVAATIPLVWRTGARVSREAAGWLATAVLFAAGVAWRNAEVLQFFDIIACLGALGLAGIVIHDVRVRVFASKLAAILLGLVRSGIGVAFGAPQLVAFDLRAPGARQSWERPMRPAIRVVLIVTVVSVVFGSLLRSADPIFASLVSLPSFDFGELVSHVVLIGFFAWVLAGWMRTTLLPVAAPSHAPAPPLFQLGMLETTATLATLNVLFGAFVIAQLGWLFGGEQFLQARTGLTAAEYARQGFFQTLWVVALVVPLLIVTRATMRTGRDVARRHTALSLPAIALVGAIIVSAALRMRLYVQYYGLSTERLYTMVIMVWLGVVLFWLAATVLRGRERSFIGGAIVSGLLTLGAVNVWSPDQIVARVNIARAHAQDAPATPIDLPYLASLGGEAIPLAVSAILDAPPSGPIDGSVNVDRCRAARSLIKRFGAGVYNARIAARATVMANVERRGATRISRRRRAPAGARDDRGQRVRARAANSRSAIIAELELHAEIALSQQRHRVLQIVFRRRRDAHLIALNRRLNLLQLRVLDRGRYLFRRIGIERGLELHFAANRVAAGLLDLADVEILHGHAALDQLRLHDVEQRAHLEIAVRHELDQLLGALELDRRIRAFEVVALRNLLLRLVDRVVDLLEVDTGGDVE